MLLKNKWGNDEIKEENGNYLKTNYNENTALKTNKQTYGGAAKAALEGKFRAIQALPQVTRKISNKQLTYNLKELWKKEHGYSRKNISSCFTDYTKAFDYEKFLKRWEYQITLSVSWETHMQIKKR